MGKSSGPAPPDPVATANAQAAANKDAAIDQSTLNQINQYTPYGSLEYKQRPAEFDQAGFQAATDQYNTDLDAYNQWQPSTGSGLPSNYGPTDGFSVGSYGGTRPTAPTEPTQEGFTRIDPLKKDAFQNLSDPQQQMLDLTNQAGIKYGQTANQQLSRVSDRLSAPLDYSEFGAAPIASEAGRQTASQAIMDRAQPLWDRDRGRLETRMAAQGISQGSGAYQDAFNMQDRAENDFRLAADQQAGNEMARTYGLERSARDSNINELIQQRQIPLNELAAMLSGSQVQNPNFVNTPQGQVAPGDVMGATYASNSIAQQNADRKNATTNAMIGGLFGLGSAGLGAYGMSRFGKAA